MDIYTAENLEIVYMSIVGQGLGKLHQSLE
jgi:hypothetical protein